MKSPMMRGRIWVARGLEWSAAGVLGLAGVLKLADPARFAAEIAGFRLVDGRVAGALSVYLPWLELAVAAGFFVGKTRAAARVLALGLLAGFSFALASAWVRGIDVRCGCFGGAPTGTLTAGLVRNAVLILALGAAARLRSTRTASDQ
jgi:hypothetical protein